MGWERKDDVEAERIQPMGGTDEILGLKSTGKKIDSYIHIYSLEERQKVVELNLTYGSINCNQGVGLI